MLLTPMAADGQEPTGSMGNDLALAVLSDRAPSLFSYFKQLFAQVTNPPIDPIREKVVMSLSTGSASEGNLLDETPRARAPARAEPADPEQLRAREAAPGRRTTSSAPHTLDITWPIDDGADGLEAALDRICAEADEARRRRA